MHDWINESPGETSIKVECECFYKDLEKELIELTGYNFDTLIDKLKAGYTIEDREENLTPHLVDITYVDDNFAVYVMGPDVKWDDLTDYEKRLVYESQKYRADKARRKI